VADALNHEIRKVTPEGVVTTIAGRAGSVGSANGTATAALLNTPYGVAVDNARNVYIADTFNQVIRKMTSEGRMSTLAGSVRNSGIMDGIGTAARFNGPAHIAVDSAGSLYVADLNNSTIRKITSAGVVSTLAGLAGNVGSADGTGSTARFNTPYGVAVDNSGNVYVADTYNHTIRKITSAGVVTTLAGLAGVSGSADGMGGAARFYLPEGITVDGGNLYVADTFNHTVRKITSAGIVSTLAGLAGNVGSTDGTGSSARFYFPYDVAKDHFSGNVYASEGNCTIRQITPAGTVTTVAGLPGSAGSADGNGSVARFNFPRGIALDTLGLVYAADTLNHTIRTIAPFDGRVSTAAGLAGNPGSSDGTGNLAEYNDVEGVAVDGAGTVYVADKGGPTIRKITSGGVVTTLAGIAGVGGDQDGPGGILNTPVAIAVDKVGNVYLTESSSNTVRKITPAGVVTTLAGSPFDPHGSADGTGSAARFYGPQGVAVDGAGNIYVADSLNHTIRKVTSGGVVTTLAGAAGAFGSVDGTGSAARFHFPRGLAVDFAGNIYVADSLNHTIRKIAAGGVVSTFAGAAGLAGSIDAIGTAARFNNPCGVALDRAGNLYVADTVNHTIRKITPAGRVSTLGGLAGNNGSTDSIGNSARFYYPYGVASDQAGNVYVADTLNYTIRSGLPAVQLGGAISHKVHGGAGFDIGLLQTGAPGIECRIGGAPGAHQVIMNFANPVAISSASASPDPLAVSATGTVDSLSINGGQVTLNLTNVSNAQTIIITLGVTDGTYTNNISLPMAVLAGDVTGNGNVNASDVSLTKSKSGQAVDYANFRADITANGVVNASDVSAAKIKSGTALP
jgi:hypothetical protein